MRDEIRVSISPGERRVALIRDDALHLAAVERPSRPDGVGDLHRARVTAVSRPMSGAFLALADGTTGFLPESETPDRKALQEGAILPLRLTRAAQGGKGPRATARLTDEERAAASGTGIALVRRGPDAALRFARQAPGAELVTDSAAEAARLRRALGERVRLDRAGAFDDALEAEFDTLAGPEVPLPGGGRITVHPGAILVDVAGLPAKRREVLAAALSAALEADPLKPRLLGLTRLGLFEIQRSRVHPPLHEVLGQPSSALTHGLAALRRAMREDLATPGRARTLRAAPGVIAALEAMPEALSAYAESAGRALRLIPDPALAPGREALEEAR